MKRKAPYIAFIFYVFSVPGFTQQPFFQNSIVGVQAHYGSFITDVPKADFLKDSYSYFGEAYLMKPINSVYQKSKYTTWWGLGAFFGNTGSKKFIGNMAGIYPFLDFSFWETKHFRTSLRAGLGLGWIEKPYDIETNHKNILIGSHLNLFITGIWKNTFKLSEKIHINAGLSFNHLSNATIKLPNLGINIPAFSAGISYAIKPLPIKNFSTPDSIDKRIKFHLQLTAGIKQSPWIESNLYSPIVFAAEVTKQKFSNFRYGAGVAFFYDKSLASQYLDTIVTIDKTSFSTVNASPYFSFEKVIGRFSIPIQFGVYILENDLGSYYQNLGFRYELNKQWSATGYLKTHWGRADFIHVGFNYTFR